MLAMTWYKHSIKTEEDVLTFIKLFKEHKPLYGAFDTETNGLNIIRSKPFLVVFGFASTIKNEGYTFSLDLELDKNIIPIAMYAVIKLFNKLKRVLAWNATYDMHMMHNIGYPNLFSNNITDVQIYVRLAHDALKPSEGGPPMALKNYANKYIDSTAKKNEGIIKALRANMRKKHNRILVTDLSNEPIPKEYQKAMKNHRKQRWTVGIVEDILGDLVLGTTEMTPKVQKIIHTWERNNPDPDNYQNIPRAPLTKYAHYDVIFTIEAFLLVMPVAVARGQETTIQLEEDLIMPLYRMEKVGFAFNKEYALESKEALRTYILMRRQELHHLVGFKLGSGQHPTIKKILNNKYHLGVESTGNPVLEKLRVENQEAQQFINLIVELRTLEKWYSTYVIKWLNEEVNGRIYTQIKQAGTVSGRVSSNFQQFPKYAIQDKNGDELFHPRKMIKVSGGNYKSIIYLDYSQIELRFQALYTIYVSGGDKNLCRAYMPFECHRGEELFDPNNPQHIVEWDTGDWYLNEDPKVLWTKTDLHDVMTLNAFPHITKDSKEFKMYRNIGKSTNFACNYGATGSGLQRDLGHSKDLSEHLYNTYLKTFPGLKPYRDYVKRMLQSQGYVENLFGRKFYGMSAHKASNYLVQGSAADFLKMKMIKADKLLLAHKTMFQMNIHDEMSFEPYEGEEYLIEELRLVMEGLQGTKVPIVADAEITYTNWAEKVNL